LIEISKWLTGLVEENLQSSDFLELELIEEPVYFFNVLMAGL
jgi:hypothetical protein